MSPANSGLSQDGVSRFLLDDLDIRGAIVHLGPAWRQMTAGRGYAAAAARLLGEMTAVTALIGSNLKTPSRLVFQLQGHGEVRLLMVECDDQLQLRGVARAPDTLEPAPLPVLLGDGQLIMTLQPENAATPYQSFVPLEGETVASVFEHFLTQSEQQPSRLWLMADEHHACGLFLQKLPEADHRDPDGWNRLQQLAGTVTAQELALPPTELLSRLFPEEVVRLFSPQPACYFSPRNEEKVLGMLQTLGREEVEKALAEHGSLVIRDEIGNHEYRFGADILDRLFPPPTRTLH